MTDFKELDSIIGAHEKNQKMVDEVLERVNALIEKVEKHLANEDKTNKPIEDALKKHLKQKVEELLS